MKRKVLCRIDPEEVIFTLHCDPEWSSVEGNCSAIDPETDAETARWIWEQLDSGNDWAWCQACVTAEYDGLTGRAYLGCCSYESEASFRECGYFDDLKKEALADLQAQLDAQLSQTLTL